MRRNWNGKPLLIAAILVGHVACKQDRAELGLHVSPRIPAIAGPIEPLTQLDDVRLGMTARELKAVRPRLEIAGYEGYSEQIGGYRIGYSIPGSWSEGQEVPLSNRLVGVSARKAFGNDSSLIQAWHETNTNLQTYAGGSAECIRFEVSRNIGRAMQWHGSARIVSAVYFADTIRIAGAPPDSGRVVVFVGDLPGLSTWMAPAKPCPEEGVYKVGPR